MGGRRGVEWGGWGRGGVAERSYPASEVRGGDERNYPASEVRGDGREDPTSKEPWLRGRRRA